MDKKLFRSVVLAALISRVLFFIPRQWRAQWLAGLIRRWNRVHIIRLSKDQEQHGVVWVGNHVHSLDWLMVYLLSPRPLCVVVNEIDDRWFVKELTTVFLITQCPITHNSAAITKQFLQANNHVLLFSDRYFSNHFEKIIPFYIHGLWENFSQSKQHKVFIYTGQCLREETSLSQVKAMIERLSVLAWTRYSESLGSIAEEWLFSVKYRSRGFWVTDATGLKLTAHKLLAVVWHMSRQLKAKMHGESSVGILLPTSVGGIIAYLTLLFLKKRIAYLNYTAGTAALKSALSQSEIKTIVTSRVFIDRLKEKGFDMTEIINSAKPIYLEDCRKKTSKLKIIIYLVLTKILPFRVLKSLVIETSATDEEPATILFSSGSEAAPKGVVLLHRQMLANVKQIVLVSQVSKKDRILGTLPMFHSFGLTVLVLMPLLEGIPLICHPDPTDILGIAKMINQYQPTLWANTPTLYGLFTRHAKTEASLLKSLRLIISGAEKLQDKIAEDFFNKFAQRIYEGYGVTEASPVISVNLPWKNKLGSVGLSLEGTALRVVDLDTGEDLPMNEPGLLLVAGPQIMQGYLKNPHKTSEVFLNEEEFVWYKTLDKAQIDADGFLTIVDRFSRFAKIGGEMVSLTMIEHQILKTFSDQEIELMALSIPDVKRGEKIALLVKTNLAKEFFGEKLSEVDLPNLMKPSLIDCHFVIELPKLGTGKCDYVTGKKMLKEFF